jgi:hypothetical protein
VPVSASESSNGLPTVLRGVIDLVFLESAGWAGRLHRKSLCQ